MPRCLSDGPGALNPASFLRAVDEGVAFQVRLTPNASKDQIEGLAADSAGQIHLRVRVRAVPEKGKANAALIALLARELGLAKSSVQIIAGQTARLKTVRVEAPQEALLVLMKEAVAARP